MEGVAEISGSLSAAGLVLILTACLTIYGAVSFQQEKSQVGVKTLSGELQPDFTLGKTSVPGIAAFHCAEVLLSSELAGWENVCSQQINASRLRHQPVPFTCTGRQVQRDPLQSSEGWQNFTAGWAVGGLSGVFWSYILTQILPYYF